MPGFLSALGLGAAETLGSTMIHTLFGSSPPPPSPDFSKRRRTLLAPPVVETAVASRPLLTDPIVQAYLGRFYG
jgi:hypothetical protein